MKKYIIVYLLFIFLIGCQENFKDDYNRSNQMGLTEPLLMPKMSSQERMVIKMINFDIEVQNFEKASNQVVDIVKNSNGYIKDTEMRQDGNQVKSGRITTMVPVDKLDIVLNKIRQEVGNIKSESVFTEDITEGYIDEKARLENKRKVEQQYQLLLKKSNTIDEMLKIEQALSVVRSEIESGEAKMKYYETQTSMSTLNITLSEPAFEGSPEGLSFITTIKNSFRHGINGLILVVGAVIIISISIIPLIPLVYFIWKWIRKKYKTRKALIA